MAAWRSKSKEWDMGDYNATLEENEARLWCIRNNIYIYHHSQNNQVVGI